MLTRPITLVGASLLLHTLTVAPFLGIESPQKKSEPPIYVSYVKYEAPEKIKAPLTPPPSERSKQSRALKRKPPAAEPTLTHSKDLLMDPKRKVAFNAYFIEIKEKIEKVIRRKGGAPGRGTVFLQFILNQKGALEGVWVMGGTSGAGTAEKSFAADCVRDAKNFEPFPKELRSERISFSLTLQF